MGPRGPRDAYRSAQRASAQRRGDPPRPDVSSEGSVEAFQGSVTNANLTKQLFFMNAERRAAAQSAQYVYLCRQLVA